MDEQCMSFFQPRNIQWFHNLRQIVHNLIQSILQFGTNTFRHFEQIHLSIDDKYILQSQTNTLHNLRQIVCNVGQLHFTIGENTFLNFRKVHLSILVWSGLVTDGDRAWHIFFAVQRFLGQTKRCKFLEENTPPANQADPLNLNQYPHNTQSP